MCIKKCIKTVCELHYALLSKSLHDILQFLQLIDKGTNWDGEKTEEYH